MHLGLLPYRDTFVILVTGFPKLDFSWGALENKMTIWEVEIKFYQIFTWFFFV